jgi:hypothetical protein
MEKTYYTYAYLREDRTPYYVGKGRGARAYRKNRVGVKPPKNKNKILVLKKKFNRRRSIQTRNLYDICVW